MLRRLKRYLLGLTLALNQFGNAVSGCDPTMTISARSGFARDRGAGLGAASCAVLDVLFLEWARHDELDHCEKAVIKHWQRRAAGIPVPIPDTESGSE